MRVVTEQYLNSLVDSIVKEKEKQAEILHQTFSGLSNDELWQEIKNHLGNQWTVKREHPMKFTRADINAVASARFFRKTGMQMLMILAIIVLALSVVVKYITMTALLYNIFYVLFGLISLGFIYIYSRKQSKARKELWRQLGHEEKEEDK